MVVLAVTWMAKAGHEAEVAATCLRNSPRNPARSPVASMYQVHRHKTEPRRFFIYEQYKDDAALEAHRTAPHFLAVRQKELPRDRATAWKVTCTNRWGSLWTRAPRPRVALLYFVRHQLAARGVAFFRHLMESNDNAFALGSSFFHHDIGDAASRSCASARRCVPAAS